ncbi:MAG: 50S ribosomal protein L15 [Mycoplasmatales bacterium]
MNLHELTYTQGSRGHKEKRLGRGNGSGYGKTAARGENGQNKRSGGGVRPGFEGGQNPLYRRLPKRGFSNAPFKTEYTEVSLSDLNKLTDGDVVTVELLKERKIISSSRGLVKVLGPRHEEDKLEKKLTVKLDKYTSAAKEAITNAGGVIEEK